MLDIQAFGKLLADRGYNHFCGVPCSYLESFIDFVTEKYRYYAATNEGDAVAIATGAMLGGKKMAVLMQNSGLTNAISPLTSLNYTFQIPILGFVSLRGESGTQDEPQHALTGSITTQLLDTMEIAWDYLSPDISKAKEQLDEAEKHLTSNRSFFFVVRRRTFSEYYPEQSSTDKSGRLKGEVIFNVRDDQMPSRYQALKVIDGLKDNNTIQIASTGKTGRELYEIEDSPQNLYMVGSMGCASALGLGIAEARKDRNVVVIEGEGALLMRLGNLANLGYYRPGNLLHIVLDNNCYDSTGGQFSVASGVDFVSLASASGYNKSIYVHDLVELRECILNWKKKTDLTFLYMKIAPGSKHNLKRPSIKPYEVKERLKVFMNE